MKTTATLSLFALLALTSARPTANVAKREVPQEHSHEKFLTSVRASLNLDNPDKIGDPIFGLLGNGAAAAGAGAITNLDCLHKATADRAFTNAKAAGDVQAQADALLYAAVERNTGAVGQASVICTDAAVNPEIEAIQQHQDPASTGAQAGNKAIALELAKQLAAIGADPQLALEAGTFAPGTVSVPLYSPNRTVLRAWTNSFAIRLETQPEQETPVMTSMTQLAASSPRTSLSKMPQPQKLTLQLAVPLHLQPLETRLLEAMSLMRLLLAKTEELAQP